MGGTGSGRPGKPTGRHHLHGTFRADRHADRVDDQIYDGVPEPPAGMLGDARDLWDLIVPSLIGAKVATAANAPQLEAMCRYWALWRESIGRVERGEVDEMDGSNLINRYYKAFNTIAIKFGMTPIDRQRFIKRAEGPKLDPAARFGIN